MYRIHREELSERVYREIKEMILKNQLTSGEKLNQEHLARRLGVSRTPLVAAFFKLEQQMLVELVPRRGAFVKKLSRKEFEDLYDIRMRLESLAAFEAALRGTAKQLGELNRNREAFEKHVLAESNQDIRELDYKFHTTIMKMSGNDLLYRMISSYNIIIMSNLEGLLKDARISMEEHRRIYTAIERQEPLKAEREMYKHIEGSRKNLAKMKLSE
jgi:DNA-binding GntR family transcriptional regulator